MYKNLKYNDIINKNLDKYDELLNKNNNDYYRKNLFKDFNKNYDIDLDLRDNSRVKSDEEIVDEILKDEREFLSPEEYEVARTYELRKLRNGPFYRTTGYLGGINTPRMGCAKSINDRFDDLFKDIKDGMIYMHDVDRLNTGFNCSSININNINK